MDDDWLVWRYESSRPRLRGMAYRMLGSANDADDAVQEGWIHVAGGDASAVANLDGWFTTIVARVCLDMLRVRTSRREDPVDVTELDRAMSAAGGADQDAILADTIGIALLVVLDTLGPAERVAFVLHDTFGLPFGEIAAITGKSQAAVRQLASRARRRIHGDTARIHGDTASDAEGKVAEQRALAEAFLAAAREGNLNGLLAVLAPEVTLHGDAASSRGGKPVTIRGALRVARASRSAAARTRCSGVVLVDGTPGIVYAPRGRPAIVLAFRYGTGSGGTDSAGADSAGTGARGEGAITGIDVIADRARLAALELTLPV